MRPSLSLLTSVIFGLVSTLTFSSAERMGRSEIGSGWLRDVVAAGTAKPAHWLAARAGLRRAPLGLAMAHPYVRGKVPVVLIHGLGGNSRSWAPLIDWLEDNPIIRDHYQIWTFGYVTGEPILYSASALRHALRQARERCDPSKTDAAFDRMVLIGYSMGGILTKLMALDSRSILWDKISSEPVDKLLGPAEARDVLRQALFFKAVPEVRSIIFIATPHRGSRVDKGVVHWLGARLTPSVDSLRSAHESLLASNQPEFFRPPFRKSLPSSVDQLEWQHSSLMTLFDLHKNPSVTYYSIIADVNDPPGPGGTDGVVPYASSHLDGARSELIIPGGHLCETNPLVIDECERILSELVRAGN